MTEQQLTHQGQDGRERAWWLELAGVDQELGAVLESTAGDGGAGVVAHG